MAMIVSSVNEVLKRALFERDEREEALRSVALPLTEAEEAAEESPDDASLRAGIEELRVRHEEAEKAWAAAHRRVKEIEASLPQEVVMATYVTLYGVAAVVRAEPAEGVPLSR
jgi:hypothetical protein